MSGLLDFALGFGQGAAGAVAYDRKSQLDMQRQANLDRLRAQYATEQKFATAGRVADLAMSDDPHARTTAGVMGYRPEGEKSAQSPHAKLWSDYRNAQARGDEDAAASILAVIEQAQAGGPDEATTADTTKELRIQRLLRANPGWTYQDAVGEVEGVERIVTDPVTGRSSVVGRGEDGGFTGRELNIDRPEAPPRREAPPATEIDDLAFNPGEGTGALASAKGLWNSTLGQFKFAPTFTGPETAAQRLTVIQRDAVSALASSGRPPVIEQERIVRMLPQPMDWSENPVIARHKLASFVDVMGLQYRSDLDAIDDPSVSESEKRELRGRVRQVENIIGRIITPEAREQFLNYSSEESTESQLTDTLKGLFAAQYEVGQTPEIPQILWGSVETEDDFEKLLKSLGIQSNQRFRTPDGRVFQRR